MNLNDYKKYLDKLGSLAIDGKMIFDSIHFCGFDEAVEYLTARMMVKKVYAYSHYRNPSTVIVMGLFANEAHPAHNVDNLNTPVSVIVNLHDSPLRGRIKSSYGKVIALGNDNYLCEIPVPKVGNNSKIILQKSDGDEIHMTRPLITSLIVDSVISFSVNKLKVEDAEPHFIVFRKKNGETDDKTKVVDYIHGAYNISVRKESGYCYRAGVCVKYKDTQFELSNVSSWISDEVN